MIHWVTNQSVCALTEIEKFLTNKTDDETFFGRLVGPVYKFKTKGQENLFLYVLMFSLFIMTFIKLQGMGFCQLKADWSRFLQIFSRPHTPPLQQCQNFPDQNPNLTQPPSAWLPGAVPQSA